MIWIIISLVIFVIAFLLVWAETTKEIYTEELEKVNETLSFCFNSQILIVNKKEKQIFQVYDIKREKETTLFLIFSQDQWQYVDSKNYIPLENITI